MSPCHLCSNILHHITLPTPRVPTFVALLLVFFFIFSPRNSIPSFARQTTSALALFCFVCLSFVYLLHAVKLLSLWTLGCALTKPKVHWFGIRFCFLCLLLVFSFVCFALLPSLIIVMVSWCYSCLACLFVCLFVCLFFFDEFADCPMAFGSIYCKEIFPSPYFDLKYIFV